MPKLEALVPRLVARFPPAAEMETAVLYVSEEYGTATHLCACGCGNEVVTPFDSPSGWDCTRDGDKVTLSPSIGNWSFPCRSHYFIRENQVAWIP